MKAVTARSFGVNISLFFCFRKTNKKDKDSGFEASEGRSFLRLQKARSKLQAIEATGEPGLLLHVTKMARSFGQPSKA